MQQMPQQTAMQQAMPVGAPAQSNKGGLGALAAQRQQAAGQAVSMGAGPVPGFAQSMQMGQPPSGFDAFMQQRQQQDAMNAQRAMQNGTMPQFEEQMRQRDMAMQGITQADIDRMRNLQMSGDPSFQAESDALNARANANRMAALQGQFGAQGGMPGMAAPGGGLFPGAQRPLPVGAGGKGTGMPPPGMVNPPRPMPLPPGLNRPMPMPMPPGSMVNPPRPIGPKPVPQPVRPTPKPMNPRFNQIMPFLR